MIKQLLDTYGPTSPEPLISDIQPVANADENYPDYIIIFLPGIEAGSARKDLPLSIPASLTANNPEHMSKTVFFYFMEIM